MLRRHFEPLPSPKPFDTTIADLPAGISEQRRNPPIAISTVLAGELDHVRHQALFISTTLRLVPLCRSMLAKNLAGPTL